MKDTAHWTALHVTTLHCTALHCTALNCTALHCTALHCTALHCCVQPSTVKDNMGSWRKPGDRRGLPVQSTHHYCLCSALQCTVGAVQFSALQYSVLQCRLHKLCFLQKLGCQKLCWDQARLSSLVNKQIEYN